MPQKNPPSPTAQAVIDRLKQLRLQMFGPRGAGQFARSLGLSPASYRRYEKDRVPDVDILSAAARATGTDLYWLITGQKPDSSFSDSIPTDRKSLLDQIDRVVSANPAALRVIRTFLDLLDEGVLGPVDPSPSDGPGLDTDRHSRGGWLPVLGRSAAGVVFFWQDLPNDTPRTPADRLSELIEAYLKAETAGTWSASVNQATDRSADSSQTASLIQVNVPSDAAVSEFLDCPAVRQRYPDAFALRIDGHSMLPQFSPADLVIVSPSVPALDGKPAVVQLRGQVGVTCKLYRRQGDCVHLIPTNDSFSTQTFDSSQILWALRVLFRVRINSSG
ncbi:MAG: helix-turn-helix domain-containing protein [Actinobacteria bacterium]|nr:helix-turn-helix domain-containing protein [Actinomycetota bacterium]